MVGVAMSPSTTDSPRDPDDLRRLADDLQRDVAWLRAEVHAKALMIEKLRAQLAVLRRARYGRKSEKLDAQVEQLELLIDDIEAGVAETLARSGVAESDAAETTETGASSKKKRKPSTRAPLPDHLPAETIVHEAPCVCPTCGGDKFGRIGADEREVLEYVPSHFKRVVHVRPKMSCRACETVVQAPMPTLPIEKGARARRCSPMSSCRSSAIICRCIVRPTSTPAAALRSTVRSWRAGSAVSPDCSNP